MQVQVTYSTVEILTVRFLQVLAEEMILGLTVVLTLKCFQNPGSVYASPDDGSEQDYLQGTDFAYKKARPLRNCGMHLSSF